MSEYTAQPTVCQVGTRDGLGSVAECQVSKTASGVYVADCQVRTPDTAPEYSRGYIEFANRDIACELGRKVQEYYMGHWLWYKFRSYDRGDWCLPYGEAVDALISEKLWLKRQNVTDNIKHSSGIFWHSDGQTIEIYHPMEMYSRLNRPKKHLVRELGPFTGYYQWLGQMLYARYSFAQGMPYGKGKIIRETGVSDYRQTKAGFVGAYNILVRPVLKTDDLSALDKQKKLPRKLRPYWYFRRKNDSKNLYQYLGNSYTPPLPQATDGATYSQATTPFLDWESYKALGWDYPDYWSLLAYWCSREGQGVYTDKYYCRSEQEASKEGHYPYYIVPDPDGETVDLFYGSARVWRAGEQSEHKHPIKTETVLRAIRQAAGQGLIEGQSE